MTKSRIFVSTFVLALSTFAGNPLSAQIRRAEPSVRLWLSGDGDYQLGDRARAFVEPREAGYLVVIQVDTEGRIRPLFPLQPTDDHYVRARKRIEIRGHGGREAFMVADTTGRGLIVAAFSKSPFGFGAFERNAHWDYRALADSSIDDAEAALMEVVNRMQPSEPFQYDLATYVVVGGGRYAHRARWRQAGPAIWWDSHYTRPRISVSIRIGSRFGIGWGVGPDYYSRTYIRPFGWWAY